MIRGGRRRFGKSAPPSGSPPRTASATTSTSWSGKGRSGGIDSHLEASKYSWPAGATRRIWTAASMSPAFRRASNLPPLPERDLLQIPSWATSPPARRSRRRAHRGHAHRGRLARPGAGREALRPPGPRRQHEERGDPGRRHRHRPARRFREERRDRRRADRRRGHREALLPQRDKLLLFPENEDYEPIEVRPADPEVRVAGKVVGVFRRLG